MPTPDREVDPGDVAPSMWWRARLVAWQMPRLLARLGHLDPRGPEEGPPALVIPGFLASDRSTMELRRAFARSGWRAHPWGMGVNRGARPETLDLLSERLDAIEDDRKVLIVGWSLGGLFARALAHHRPDRVRAVVTLASPFSGDLKTNTNVRHLYERIAGHDVNQPPFPPGEGKPPVPSLAFWSREDGIVAPNAARGSKDEVDRAIEIDTHHIGVVLYRPALSQVCHQVRGFVEECEGCCPIHGSKPN
ncbi:esterase/lipase family protein [Sphingomicrobium clamense]|uniref:Alpha/beta hydrolase n=1 Tax=Sphingomicrobium clamense TaxID=2851013 RepID=A0ABS6V2L2_9SPHN|nr:alpha/beta fold hydrolase [Sphingomicrobium sp. B8]MBW0143803.1 alpha/beta hydrolase [Sphingomicrobium sp. B8]